jgi:acyl carrier protein
MDTSRASVAAIRADIRQFIVTNFLFGTGVLGDDDSFLEAGIIDSTGVLELVGFLQKKLNVVVSDQELVPDNLDSVNRVASFVCRKLQS